MSFYSLQAFRNHNIISKSILLAYFNWVATIQLLFNSPMCKDSYDYCHDIKWPQPNPNWPLNAHILYLKPDLRLSFASLCSFAKWIFHCIFFFCVFPFGVRDYFSENKVNGRELQWKNNAFENLLRPMSRKCDFS